MSYLNNDLIVKELLKILPNHVFWKDINGVYQGCNKVFAQGLGFSSEEELIGKSDYDLPIDKKISDLYRQDDLSVMDSKSSKLNIEEEQTFINGKKSCLLTSKVPIFDEDENVVGILGVYIDITERKIAENELMKSKNAAEAANRAKTEFLANISHDMKTPLAGIVTTAEVIISDPSMPESGRKYGEIIAASGKQLADFFTSCLDLSKMEMQEWVSNISVFSVNQLLEDIRALYLPQAMSNHLFLQIERSEVLPKFVEGHRDSLYRVLLNLVGNAIKFTEQGGVTLRTKVLKQIIDDEHVSIEFQVQDTGIGIPEEKYQAIFEKLHRLKPSYESKIEGSGIGLYIVDQYIKRMGGHIRVESKVGQGSTFTIIVPLRKISDEVESSSIPIVSPDVVIAPIVVREKALRDIELTNFKETQDNIEHLPKVLLVEDNEMVQFVTKSLLNTAGFFVDIASTGEEALEMYESNKYGLIFMDIGLPKMSGYETAKAIRDKEKALKVIIVTPIIALTGHGATDIQRFCGEAGMQGILSKPLSREQAQMVWKHFKEDANILIPGLTLLTQHTPEISINEIVDIEETIKMIGAKDIALNLMATLVNDLKEEFLPRIKTLIFENKIDELRFLLHRQLGALKYAKARRLEKALLDLQEKAQKDVRLDKMFYHNIEKEVLRVIDYYEKTFQTSR